MPPVIFAAVVASVTWALLLRATTSATEFWLLAAASLAMLYILIMTRVLNIPINRRLMTWNVQAPPPDWATVWQRSERIHSQRTVLAIIAFVLQVVAVSLFATTNA